jgi:hypothetical protein
MWRAIPPSSILHVLSFVFVFSSALRVLRVSAVNQLKGVSEQW